jgi:hypothetical protein
MSGPNYGIQMALGQMQLPKRNNPLLEEIVNYQLASRDKDQADASLGIAKAQQELYGTQNETARKKLEYLPQEMELEKQKALAAINATNASAAASQQGARTESLRQQMLQNEMKTKQAATVFELASSVRGAEPAKKEAAYNFALNQAKAMGADISSMPQKWGPEAEAFVDNAYAASGRQLKELMAQQEMAKIPLETVINPATGKAVYVRRDRAEGLQPADPRLGGAGGANPLQSKQLATLQTQAASDAQKANELKNQLDAFQAVTNNMPVDTGAKFKIPGSTLFSTDAQNANQITKNLVLEGSSVLKGAISDRDMVTIEASMPSITNTPQANKAIIDRMKAGAERKQQKPLFIQAMTKNGIYDSGLIDAAWTQYMNENSLFDSKTGKPIAQNISNWKKYTSPDYINKLTQGGGDTSNQAAEQNALPVRRYNPETGMIE